MVKPEVFIKTVRQSFIGAEQVYTQGSCVMFYLILKTIYPNAKPYWSSKAKHMITKIGSSYYDITGQVKCTRDYKIDDKEEYASFHVSVALPRSKMGVHRMTSMKRLG
jgi:hypothetical protein